MERREFCELLNELLEYSGYSLTSNEIDYDWDENELNRLVYHTPEDMLDEAGYIPISNARGDHDSVKIYLNYVLLEELSL